MFRPHVVSYEDLTDHWIHDIHDGAKSTDTLDALTSAMGSRSEAIATIVELTAPSHFDCSIGERIEHLSRWRSNLQSRVADTFKIRLEEGLSADEANADSLLIDIRAIQLGVRRATVTQHRFLADRRDMRRTAGLPKVIDPSFFEPHP